MKLIEKLAIEFDEQWCKGDLTVEINDLDTGGPYGECFARGFLKAREMAAELVSRNQYDVKVVASEIIPSMGEEQVNPDEKP